MGFWASIADWGRQKADKAARAGSFDVTLEVDASPERVWDVLTDVEAWPDWGPSIRDVELEAEALEQGARGRIQTAAGLWLDFEITEWEPGRHWTWRVGGVTATGHRVDPLADGRSRLVFEVPIVAAPYAEICRRAARRIAELAKS